MKQINVIHALFYAVWFWIRRIFSWICVDFRIHYECNRARLLLAMIRESHWRHQLECVLVWLYIRVMSIQESSKNLNECLQKIGIHGTEARTLRASFHLSYVEWYWYASKCFIPDSVLSAFCFVLFNPFSTNFMFEQKNLHTRTYRGTVNCKHPHSEYYLGTFSGYSTTFVVLNPPLNLWRHTSTSKSPIEYMKFGSVLCARNTHTFMIHLWSTTEKWEM